MQIISQIPSSLGHTIGLAGANTNVIKSAPIVELLVSPISSPEEIAIKDCALDKAKTAIGKDWACVEQVLLEGKTIKEAAKTLCVSEKTISRKLRKALRAIDGFANGGRS